MEAQTKAPSTVWALGDYHRFAKEMVWSVGPVLVAACGIGPGQRVLDVAAGTGNVAIRAAEAGADVVASDLTPESLAAGEREARERGVELEWVVADADDLRAELALGIEQVLDGGELAGAVDDLVAWGFELEAREHVLQRVRRVLRHRE